VTVTGITLGGAGFGVVALFLLPVIINAVESERLFFGPLGSLTRTKHPLIYQAVVALLVVLINVLLSLAMLLVFKGTEIDGKADPRGQMVIAFG
jgi:hypothetical protein